MKLLLALCGCACLVGAVTAAVPAGGAPVTAARHVPWSRNAVIYEVNLRQYTPEGTLAAFARHLPELKALGADILWLMPVQPIGVKDRKGPLGSYYAIRDYQAINPEFGTLEDFRSVVQQAHALGMHVILDWVANHTSLDHPWITQHPEWYQQNAQGQITSYDYDNGTTIEHWSDVAGLDYRAPEVRAQMIAALRFWIRETGIDGFRCDVAGRVPVSFWDDARAALERDQSVFMLAEADKPELAVRAFDMSYDWDLKDVFRAIGKGKAGAAEVRRHFEAPRQQFPADSYQMLFTSNHDLNSWDGSDEELYGPAHDALSVLSFTLPGMPLIYGGQEAGNTHRLLFFDRDPIDWKTRARAPFYRGLVELRHGNPALASGSAGGPLEFIASDNPAVLAFSRHKGRNLVTVVVNLSAERQAYRLAGMAQSAALEAWAYSVDERH